MKCTECNKTVKPVVAIDIDGTMGNYHQHFLIFASGYLNRPINNSYRGKPRFKEWFCDNYQCTADDWHDIKLAYRQGGMKRTMPVYNDARTLMTSMRMLGAEIWVTTTRPYVRHDNVDPDTREWLARNYIPYDYLIYDGHKYGKLAELVNPERVCAILEDLVEEIGEAVHYFGKNVPILRRTPFNTATSSPGVSEAASLLMAEKIMRNKVNKWKEAHGEQSVRRDDRAHPAGASVQISGQVR
jgi:hypothetical protein